MKRNMLREEPARRGRILLETAEEVPEEIAAYVAQLKLLYPVPFGCLVPDEALLPPESMRFFCLDENWCSALADGALSIGRGDSGAARWDGASRQPVTAKAKGKMGDIRYEKVHENHRRGLEEHAAAAPVRSGFLLRSQLSRRWKGLEVRGYHGDTLLNILRMDMLAADIVIGIFDGELTRVVVSEPKTGLRFGVLSQSRELSLREIREDKNFGHYRKEKITLKCDENGRLDVLAARKDMEQVLGAGTVTPSVFAFELMQAAQEARFTAKGGEKA